MRELIAYPDAPPSAGLKKCFVEKPFGEFRFFEHNAPIPWASPVTLSVKNLPVMQETWVQSLGCEDPLKQEMATHSRMLAWKSHAQSTMAGYSPWGLKESDTA